MDSVTPRHLINVPKRGIVFTPDQLEFHRLHMAVRCCSYQVIKVRLGDRHFIANGFRNLKDIQTADSHPVFVIPEKQDSTISTNLANIVWLNWELDQHHTSALSIHQFAIACDAELHHSL